MGATTYSNSTSAVMVIDAYHAMAKRNEIRKDHGLKPEKDLTVEGICAFMSERKLDIHFAVPKLKPFLRDEKVSDQKVADGVAKRIFIVQSLRKVNLQTDPVLTYTIKQIDHEVLDLVIRFLHGKMNLTSHEISTTLNIGDQKAYAVTSKLDAELASKKKILRQPDGRPNIFAPIPPSTNIEIDKLIAEGKMSDRLIAEKTGVSIASVQNRRSRKNARETVRIMEKASEKVEAEEVGPSDVFGIAMFPKKETNSVKETLRA